MARRLLATSVLVGALRNPRGGGAERLRRMAAGDLCTSVIVAGELRFGAVKTPLTRPASAAVEALLRALAVGLKPP
jgi:tRNA(fMet)-specific endonuclease VapC